MVLEELWDLCLNKMFPIPSTDILFNQYKDFDERVDVPNAAEIRKNNLFNYLKGFQKKPEFLVVAEAPGPWGCRFSGVALTSERQLISNQLPFSGQASSRNDPEIDIKKLPPYWSNTSDQFWEIMLPYYSNILVWNCVPFHPHKPGMILNPVRNPSPKEVKQFSHIINELNIILNPNLIISIGKISYNELNQLKIHSNYVRHPSFGGFNEFKKGILSFFGNSTLCYRDEDTIKHTRLFIKSTKKEDQTCTGIDSLDFSVETAIRNAKIVLIEQSRITGIASSWKEATNRSALIAILMASKHAGMNVKKDYFEYVSRLTGKSCQPMPNFIGKLKKTPLVDKELNWQDTIFNGAEQLAELLF